MLYRFNFPTNELLKFKNTAQNLMVNLTTIQVETLFGELEYLEPHLKKHWE